MYTTYHLSSAQEITTELLESIKKTFKSKPITITVEEEMDATDYLMSSENNKKMLDESILEDKNQIGIVLKFL